MSKIMLTNGMRTADFVKATGLEVTRRLAGKTGISLRLLGERYSTLAEAKQRAGQLADKLGNCKVKAQYVALVSNRGAAVDTYEFYAVCVVLNKK